MPLSDSVARSMGPGSPWFRVIYGVVLILIEIVLAVLVGANPATYIFGTLALVWLVQGGARVRRLRKSDHATRANYQLVRPEPGDRS
jgi:hypothetical protein